MDENGTNVRRRALFHVIVSGAVGVFLVVLLQTSRGAGGILRRGVLLVAALPWAWLLVQMAALVSGVPFVRMAKRWDSLTGAHRFLLGMTIVGIAFVVFGGIGLAVAMSLMRP